MYPLSDSGACAPPFTLPFYALASGTESRKDRGCCLFLFSPSGISKGQHNLFVESPECNVWRNEKRRGGIDWRGEAGRSESGRKNSLLVFALKAGWRNWIGKALKCLYQEELEGSVTPALYPPCNPLSCTSPRGDGSGTEISLASRGPLPPPQWLLYTEFTCRRWPKDCVYIIQVICTGQGNQYLSHTHTHTPFNSVIHLRLSYLNTVAETRNRDIIILILEPLLELQDGCF